METDEIQIDGRDMSLECDASGNPIRMSNEADDENNNDEKADDVVKQNGDTHESAYLRTNSHGSAVDNHEPSGGLHNYSSSIGHHPNDDGVGESLSERLAANNPQSLSSKDQHLSSYISSRLRSYADSSQFGSSAVALHTNVSISLLNIFNHSVSGFLSWRYLV